jgi:hypothetical protein
VLVGIALTIIGLGLSVYSIPPVSPIAFLALVTGIALILAGVTLITVSLRGPSKQ